VLKYLYPVFDDEDEDEDAYEFFYFLTIFLKKK
jgi:hypothetical protein